jgi:hypothetical protein
VTSGFLGVDISKLVPPRGGDCRGSDVAKNIREALSGSSPHKPGKAPECRTRRECGGGNWPRRLPPANCVPSWPCWKLVCLERRARCPGPDQPDLSFALLVAAWLLHRETGVALGWATTEYPATHGTVDAHRGPRSQLAGAGSFSAGGLLSTIGEPPDVCHFYASFSVLSHPSSGSAQVRVS